MQEARYKAFISYSHADEAWAKWLHRALEGYRVPKHLVGRVTSAGPVPDRLSPIFRDRDELPTATNLGATLLQALEQSAAQIVICSTTAATSRWVNEEILTFKRLGREHRIFCLIVNGEPGASARPETASQECFPRALVHRLAPDGSLSAETLEPIAADARPNKDTRQDVKLKLVAGLLDLGLNELKRREQQRRNRRLALLATASVAGMAVTSTLAATAWLARNEAERERQRATAEAETARQTTRFMVDLFKVSDPSEALGNTITAREILDQGARRIQYELGNQPEVRATLLDTVGTVYGNLGLYGQAGEMLGQALSTRRQLFGERHALVARSEANIGLVLQQQARYEEAAREYEAAVLTLRADPAAAAELARALKGLANVRSGHGDHVAAEKLLREAIAIERRAGESMDLAQSLDDLGLVLTYQARYADAESALRDSMAMFRRLVPSGVHPGLNMSVNNLALMLYGTGHYSEAEKLFHEALEVNTRLLGDKHPDVAVSLNNLAMVLQDSGKLAEAEGYLRRALDIRRASLGEHHPQTAQALNNLAFVYHDQGKTRLALEYARRALAGYRAAYDGDHTDIAYALQSLAQWLVETGDYRRAGPLVEEALAINQRLLPSGHTDIAITQSYMALYLLRTGHASEALVQATGADESLTRALGADHWRTAWARSLRGAALTAQSHYAEAERLVVQSYDRLRKTAGVNRVQLEWARSHVEQLYTAWGKPDIAPRYGAAASVAAASAQRFTEEPLPSIDH